MSSLTRDPVEALRPFVKAMWASDGGSEVAEGAREHVLPTGMMHLVIRLSPEPILICERDQVRDLGHAVIAERGRRTT